MFDGTTFAEDISTGQSDLLKNLFEDAQAMLEVEVRRPCCRIQTNNGFKIIRSCNGRGLLPCCLRRSRLISWASMRRVSIAGEFFKLMCRLWPASGCGAMPGSRSPSSQTRRILTSTRRVFSCDGIAGGAAVKADRVAA